ncbi:hypothetical protein FRC02_005500 [Tulasnella sp. 418]|nr:hypothetical protein FRC02_005500 [Tulasnella sp. 418]
MARARSPTKSPPRKTRSSSSNSVKKQSKKPFSHVRSQSPSSLEEEDQSYDKFDDPDYDWLSDESQDMDSSVLGPEEDLDVDACDDTISAEVPDPKTLKGMPLEEKILASKYLHATGSSNMTKACNLFGIKQGKEYARFRRRHQGLNQPARFAQVKRQRLSPAQELTLVEWCIHLTILGVPLNRTTILPRAQMILDPNDPKNANVKPPGSSWLKRFLHRYRDVLKSGRPEAWILNVHVASTRR